MVKLILKDALCGISELQDRDIVHTNRSNHLQSGERRVVTSFWIDIKAHNVFVDWKGHQDGAIIERVQLGDLQDATHIPPRSHMIGQQAGAGYVEAPKPTPMDL